jgi:YVTN family beta-propeller protein
LRLAIISHVALTQINSFNKNQQFRGAMMQNDNSHGSCASVTRGFIALFAMLSMGLASMASPADAAPFAYVVNAGSSVSVIDIGTNTVVATVPVGNAPSGVAVTPDGKHVYVTSDGFNNVSVIDTASDTVVATVTPVDEPFGVAITPDGQHAYVANFNSNSVAVIDTATNTVVATVPVGSGPWEPAVTPDGKHVYVTNFGTGNDPGIASNVSVIDTATNTVVTTITVGSFPIGVAITPDGQHAYVANNGSHNVSVIATATNKVVATVGGTGPTVGVAITPDGKHAYVTSDFPNRALVIDTATNTVVATVTVGNEPFGVAITPDGKHAYVTNRDEALPAGSVSVIDTTTNTVAATVLVGVDPVCVGIIPPPPGVPFLAFSAKLAIQFGSIPTKDAFGLGSGFMLSITAPALNPLTAPVTLQIGTFSTTIPAGSFKKQKDGSFAFKGVIDGVSLEALIKQTGTLRYAFQAKATGANLTGTENQVYATLIIGGNSGATSVTAEISH